MSYLTVPVMYARRGNLDSHNHKEGWLSGSFYLKLPESRMGERRRQKIAFNYEDRVTHPMGMDKDAK